MNGKRSPNGYRLSGLVFIATTFAVLTISSVRSPAQPNSRARIVRLSFVEGNVNVYRPDVDEWAQAFINTPIQQGFKIATDANSFAEVEFENGSTARLGQSSELNFTDLSLSPDGGKINHLTLARGYATFTVEPERGDTYRIQAAGSSYVADARSMFRIDLDQDNQRLEVFKGEVGVQSPYGNGTVAKSQALELEPGSSDQFQITDGVSEDAWDRWVMKRQQTESASINAGAAGLSAQNSLYGWNDLSYFGAWNVLPGYGSCWSPMMGAGWSPYSIGRWSWYPGFGYTWISALPWGWLPFHYGSWIYPARYGWCWLPGNFSSWSPGLVTWYEGPNWVSWAPLPYAGGSRPSVLCPHGENCSTSVSFNTFQSGKPISPNDVLGVNPIRGRAVSSPTVPVTRGLRLPGPALIGSPFSSSNHVALRSGTRVRRIGAAPTTVFATGTISGNWNVRPHAPEAGGREIRPNNNDMLLHFRTATGRRGSHPGGPQSRLTSIPVSALGTRERLSGRSSFLIPSARPSGNSGAIRSFHEPRMPVFRDERFSRGNQLMRNQERRRQMQMSQRSRASRQHFRRSMAPRPSSGGFSGTRSMGAPRESMGGMRGGMRGGTGGGERGSARPHR